MSRLGIDGFDQLVPETIPKPGAVLLLVPPAEEKDQIAAQFVLEGLRNGDVAIVLGSEAGIRDLVRRAGNLGFDAEKSVAQGRLVPVDWERVVAPKNGNHGGLPAVEAALTAAAGSAKGAHGLRILVDLSRSLPQSLAALSLDDVAVKLLGVAKASAALSLFLAHRAGGVTPAAVEAFDLVLDLRPLKPAGVGLAVVAIGGTPLPRSGMVLASQEGRLVLEPSRRTVVPPTASVECPVCKSIIPAGAPECPVCKSPRPVRRPGESEVLDYIEALGQRVGLPGAPLEPSAPAPPPPADLPPPPPAEGKEGAPARPEPARRGLTNGLAKKRRMAAPAAPQGRVNGLTSTLAAARRGMTNGLTNGNGFTNGLGAQRFVSESRARVWRVYLIPIIAVALLSLPLFFVQEQAPANMTGIDGSFTEWTSRVPFATNLSLPGSIDLTAGQLRADNKSVYGFLETRDALLQGSPDGLETDAFRAFIDTDGNASTGYLADGVGAEMLVEITGARGSIVDANVYTFQGSGEDWTGWRPAGPALAAAGRGTDANRLEFSIPVVPKGNTSLRVAFESRTFDGREDTSGFALSPSTGTLIVEQQSIAPATDNGSAEFLQLRLRTSRGPASLTSFTVTATGTFPTSDLDTANLRDSSQAIVATAGGYQNGFNFTFSPRYTISEAPTILRVSARTNNSATGTLGFAIATDADIHADGTTVSLSTLIADRDLAYVGTAPPGLVIDGAFADWPLPLADGIGEATTQGNANVDIAAYDSVRSGTGVAVYVRTVGRVLSGALVPAQNPQVPRAAPLDADRDGVPDSVDPFPHDFNNDGVPDASSVLPDGRPDVDRDGVADYPGGPDLWLNTTIPASFPAPYAGRFVSVYIGPVQRPVARGDDILRVYIDSDANASTGYATSVGADWMVEITGRHGVPRTKTVSRFTGVTPGTWSWAIAGTPALAVGSRQLELAAALTPGPIPGTQIVVDLRDWRGGFDTSGIATRGATRSSTGASVDAGLYSADLPADLSSSDGVAIATTRFSATWRLTGISAEGPGGVVPLVVTSDPLVLGDSSASYALRVGATSASLRYTFGAGGLKEELVLDAPPVGAAATDSLHVRFSVSLSSGASILPVSGPPFPNGFGMPGDVAIVVAGTSVARFPAPFATDAGVQFTSCEYATPSPGILDVVCPMAILRGASYPVVIDPSTTFTLSNNGPNGQAGEDMGWSTAVGDFNGDGYLDVLTGAPLNDKDAIDAGIAYIYLGPFTANTSTPSVNLKGNGTTLYRAGYGVAAGDFNNDGYDDAVVGQQNGGPTLVYYGRASWPVTVSTANVTFPVPSPVAAESFGRTLAAGNFDNSGGADLVIGRPFYPSATVPDGRVYLFFSPFSAYEPTADLVLAPFNNTKGRFGWSMATGKIDSDARDDLIVGEIVVAAPTPPNTFGRISLFKGSSLTGSGTKTPDRTIIHTTAGSQFGSAVSVGKLNGDTYADVLVGAPAFSLGNGAAYIFLAKADGSGLDQNQSASVTLPNQAVGEKFGSSVLIGDDFNDGTNDAIVGAIAYNLNQGRVYVFNNPLVDQTVDETLTGQGTGATPEQFGTALAGGKRASDAKFVLAIGGPFWDDTGKIDAGRVTVASIPEFSDVGPVAGLAVLVLLLVRRRRRTGA